MLIDWRLLLGDNKIKVCPGKGVVYLCWQESVWEGWVLWESSCWCSDSAALRNWLETNQSGAFSLEPESEGHSRSSNTMFRCNNHIRQLSACFKALTNTNSAVIKNERYILKNSFCVCSHKFSDWNMDHMMYLELSLPPASRVLLPDENELSWS